MRKADFPEEMMQAVGHEPERRRTAASGDFGDVVAELFVGLARVARGSLRFDDGENGAAGVVEAEVGEAVPGRRVIASTGTSSCTCEWSLRFQPALSRAAG